MMILITTYIINKKVIDLRYEKRKIAKLYKKEKYIRKSARNSDEHAKCMLLSVLAFVPP